ncbi:hypothetical protein HYQ46_001100 [Verticillium longisporum]|nr:hypothetical protein HYQ46_001100 [Verticillium longisporum]
MPRWPRLVDEVVLGELGSTADHGAVHEEAGPDRVGALGGDPLHGGLVVATISNVEVVANITLDELGRLLLNSHALEEVGDSVIDIGVRVLVDGNARGVLGLSGHHEERSSGSEDLDFLVVCGQG